MSFRFGFGGFPGFLTPKTLGSGQIELLRAPSVSELLSQSKAELEESLEALKFFDHVIFRLSGENPNELVHFIKMHGLLEKFLDRPFTASFWTMDSHHLVKQEAKAAKHFDYIFVAHKQYLKFFDPSKARYLPCSFSLTSSTEVSRYLAEPPKHLRNEAEGACAVFAAYPWQKRNAGYSKFMELAGTLGIDNSFVGKVYGGMPPNDKLIKRMLEHKVVVNLSLSDDLNMRNFEALALNRILLTNKVLDHELLGEFEENIVYFDEGLGAIENGALEALRRVPEDISQKFLSKHGIEVRILDLVESLSGYVASGEELQFSRPVKPSETSFGHQNGETVIELAHSQTELLAKSGWVSIRDLSVLLRNSENKLGTLVRFTKIWCKSFGFHVLHATVGRITFARALLRVARAEWSPFQSFRTRI